MDMKGQVYAWGLSNFGQTGIPQNAGESDAFVEKPTIVQSLADYKIKEIKGGNHHSIACTEGGKLLVWGRCDDSQAGIPLEDILPANLIFDGRQKPRILMKPTIIPGNPKKTSSAKFILTNNSRHPRYIRRGSHRQLLRHHERRPSVFLGLFRKLSHRPWVRRLGGGGYADR